jgi:hypothetical protein
MGKEIIMDKKEMRTYIGVLVKEIDHLKLKQYEEGSSVNVLGATIATLEARVKELAHIEYIHYSPRRF